MLVTKRRNKRKISDEISIRPKKVVKRDIKNNDKYTEDDDEEEQSDDEEVINPFNLLKFKDEMIYRSRNHIYFRAEINFQTINKLGKFIDTINREYEVLVASLSTMKVIPKPIYLHITSEGGLVFAALLAVDMIKNSRIPIYTIVEGRAVSAATLLSIVGKKRFMTENSYVLIHQLSSVETGNFEQLKDGHKNNNTLMKHMNQIYSKHSKMTQKQLSEALKHDVYWDFNKAKKLGLVDEIYRSIPVDVDDN